MHGQIELLSEIVILGWIRQIEHGRSKHETPTAVKLPSGSNHCLVQHHIKWLNGRIMRPEMIMQRYASCAPPLGGPVSNTASPKLSLWRRPLVASRAGTEGRVEPKKKY